MLPKRYLMLEKAEGGAVVVDREKVICALSEGTGRCSIIMTDRSAIALNVAWDEAADLLTLRLRFDGSGSPDGRPAACNRDHFISADEVDGAFRIRFSNDTSCIMPGVTAEMFLDVILQMEGYDAP